jgi:hypothetical protein
MKWSYFVEQKIKVALLLSVVMFLVILTSIIERKNIGDINNSVHSMYEDRLVPATDLFSLTENLYSKRFLIESYLKDNYRGDQDRLALNLKEHDKNIESLISKYEKTYLVDQESKYLTEFKSKVKYYSSIESDILELIKNDSKAAALNLYQTRGVEAHKNTIYQLSVLNQIQAVIANELVKDSKGIVASSNLLSTLQIVLAIITGVIIIILIFSSRIVNQTNKSYHLN